MFSPRLYEDITFATGCSNATNTLDYLRYLPFETLKKVLNSSVTNCYVNTSLPNLNELPNACQLQVPVVDGDFIVQSATTQLQNGQFIKVPILIGCTLIKELHSLPRV